MSRENVEKVKRVFGPDPSAFFDLLHDDVVVDPSTFPLPDWTEVVRGRDDAIRHWQRYWGAWTEYSFELREAIAAGDDVVVVADEAGTGKGSGVPLERTWASVWTFRDGKVIRVAPYETREEALEAVGLRG